MDHPNATLYRDLMAKMTAGDVDGAWETSTCRPLARSRQPGRHRRARCGPGSLDGHERDPRRVDIHDVLANDEHVLAMLRVSLTGPAGKSVGTPWWRLLTSAMAR